MPTTTPHVLRTTRPSDELEMEAADGTVTYYVRTGTEPYCCGDHIVLISSEGDVFLADIEDLDHGRAELYLRVR